MQERVRCESGRTTMICVDSYEKGILCGRFYNYGQEEESRTFHSLAQLLVGMEHMLDTTDQPPIPEGKHTFFPTVEPKLDNPAEDTPRKGRSATFVVRILFQQHTSWQGTISWLEERCEQTFRSVLELILLMDSALTGATA